MARNGRRNGGKRRGAIVRMPQHNAVTCKSHVYRDCLSSPGIALRHTCLPNFRPGVFFKPGPCVFRRFLATRARSNILMSLQCSQICSERLRPAARDGIIPPGRRERVKPASPPKAQFPEPLRQTNRRRRTNLESGEFISPTEGARGRPIAQRSTPQSLRYQGQMGRTGSVCSPLFHCCESSPRITARYLIHGKYLYPDTAHGAV